MKRLILLILLIPWLCLADTNPYIIGQVISTGETASLEVGYPTKGASSASSANGRRVEIDVPSGGITVRYGYAWASSAGTTGMTMAVYTTGGSQVGTCSDAGTVAVVSSGRSKCVFSTPFFLAEGTYYLQTHYTGDNITYYYDASAGSNNAYGGDACGTLYTTPSGNRGSSWIANYEAY